MLQIDSFDEFLGSTCPDIVNEYQALEFYPEPDQDGSVKSLRLFKLTLELLERNEECVTQVFNIFLDITNNKHTPHSASVCASSLGS